MNVAVYVGRFQPFHKGHHTVLMEALSRYDRVLIVVGSADKGRTRKNPWSAVERVATIATTLAVSGVDADRVLFDSISDHPSDSIWTRILRKTVEARFPGIERAALLGLKNPEEGTAFGKNDDGFFLFDEKCGEHHFGINAEDIREKLFSGITPDELSEYLPDAVIEEISMTMPSIVKYVLDHEPIVGAPL